MESLGTEALLREVIQHSTLNIKRNEGRVSSRQPPLLILTKLYLKTILTFNS
nr:MAG TPA: hypothetical protein [Caudoviricetes sp.]